MDNNLIDNVLKILQIADILIGIICAIAFKNKLKVIVVVILCFIIISLLGVLYSKEKYIRFIDFLFENEKHNFNLLPKMRIYLNKKKICNKLNIKFVEVIYDIKHKQSTESDLLGDVDIIYKLDIENKSIPDTYYFITGNDYSNNVPQIQYKYGIMDEYSRISPKQKSCARYCKDVVREFSFNLDKRYIPPKNILSIELKISYKDSFEFRHNYLDTIICLPQIFGVKVEQMKYNINLLGFPSGFAFYFFTYIICENRLKYNINDIPNKCEKKNEKFSVEFYPGNSRDEKAYYFRIGIKDIDEENRF